MTLDEFVSKVRVAASDAEYREMDVLCIKWLKQASREYGGGVEDTVVKLLDVIKGLMR